MYSWSACRSIESTRKNCLILIIGVLLRENLIRRICPLDLPEPGFVHGSEPDTLLPPLILQELRAAFEAEAKETGNERLLLSAAVGAGKSTVDKAYEIGKIAKWVRPEQLETPNQGKGDVQKRLQSSKWIQKLFFTSISEYVFMVFLLEIFRKEFFVYFNLPQIHLSFIWFPGLLIGSTWWLMIFTVHGRRTFRTTPPSIHIPMTRVRPLRLTWCVNNRFQTGSR